MKLTVALIVLAFVVSSNAYIVYQHAKYHSPVGSHGPALINLNWPNSYKAWDGKDGGWNGGNSGNDGNAGGWGGDAGHGHEAKYYASNLGAVHIAPLIGHIQSVKSTNEQPAPGTKW